MTDIELSLVVPLYNEEENVEPLVARALEGLAACPGPAELILVDDGSSDGTGRALRRAAADQPRVRVIALRRRFGKGEALAAGFDHASGRLLATIDADLQEDPCELARLVEALGRDYDLVTGWRAERQDSWIKRWQSNLFRGVIRAVTRRTFRDINCGFKVMRREVAEDLVLTGGRFRFIPLLAEWWGYRTTEVAVSHRPRERGRSNFGANRFPGALIDLVAILCLIRYHSRPGHLFIQLGTLSTLTGSIVGGYLALLRVIRGTIDWRYPLLATSVLLIVVGVQLIATGFLAEWLAYTQRRREPAYRIAWTLDHDDSPESESE